MSVLYSTSAMLFNGETKRYNARSARTFRIYIKGRYSTAHQPCFFNEETEITIHVIDNFLCANRGVVGSRLTTSKRQVSFTFHL